MQRWALHFVMKRLCFSIFENLGVGELEEDEVLCILGCVISGLPDVRLWRSDFAGTFQLFIF